MARTRGRGVIILLTVAMLAGCGSSSPASPGTASSAASSPAPSVTTPAPPSPSSVEPPNPAAQPSERPSPKPGPATLTSRVERAPATARDAKAGARATNALAVDLYRQMTAKDDNLVFSPASVMLALGLARAGARGATADQMDQVMRDAATAGHAAWLNGLEQALSERNATYRAENGDRRKVALRVANAAFLQRDYPFRQAYLDALAERFGAGVRLVDYRADPQAARKVINGWVDRRTEGRIPSLLQPKDVRTTTRFALVNAIYLKAAWNRTFSPDDTRDARFTRSDGSVIRVPTMVGPKEMGMIRYATGSGWRAGEIPYAGSKLAMTVIVPDSMAAFEKALSARHLRSIVGAVADAPWIWPGNECEDCGIAWKIALPKFSFESRSDLVKALAAVGMPVAFEPDRADFTGIADPASTGEPPLFIRKVIHQANIEVDEQGTTAAASTAILGETGGGPEYRVFRANRPFLFVIRDVPTGAILFMGRVMDPSAH